MKDKTIRGLYNDLSQSPYTAHQKRFASQFQADKFNRDVNDAMTYVHYYLDKFKLKQSYFDLLKHGIIEHLYKEYLKKNEKRLKNGKIQTKQ